MIREVTINDINEIFNISNNEIIRKNSFNTNKILYEDHIKWFNKIIYDNNTLFLVYEENNKLLGQCRIEYKNNEYIVGISVLPEAQGKGIGYKLLKYTIDEYKKIFKKDITLYAYIKKENIASIKLFEKAGFKLSEEVLINEIPAFKYYLKLLND